jgi:phage regulator Rha-like protein
MVKKINTITSLEIANITGKSHKHILRDIRNIIKNLEDHKIIIELHFGLSE